MYSTNYTKKQRSALLASMKKNSITGLTKKIKSYLRENDARITPMLGLLWEAYPVKKKEEKLGGCTLEKFVRNYKGDGIKMKLSSGDNESISVPKMVKFFLNPNDSRKIIQQHACEGLKKAARYEVRSQTTAFREKEVLKLPDYANGNKYHVGHDYEEGERFIEIFEMFCKQKLKRGTKIEVYSEPGSNIKRFKNEVIANMWAAYHEKNARLRMEKATDNLQGNRGFQVKEPWIHEYTL